MVVLELRRLVSMESVEIPGVPCCLLLVQLGHAPPGFHSFFSPVLSVFTKKVKTHETGARYFHQHVQNEV
jgi:hypothetical protein